MMPRIASAAGSLSATGDAANAAGSGHTTSPAAMRGIEQIRRQAEMHRARPAGTRDPDRLRHLDAEGRHRCRGPRRLRHRRRHLGLAQFLKAAAPKLVGLGVARQQHQRRFLALRRHQCGGGVGMTRTAGDHGDARLAGQPSPGVGHVHRRGLMPRVHQPLPRIDRRVEQRHDVVAGQREDRVVAGAFQRAHDDVGAADGCAAHGDGFP